MQLNTTANCCSSSPLTETTAFSVNYTEQLDWILPITLNLISVVAEIWLLGSLVHYGIKTKKWKELRRGNPDKLNSGAVYTALVACAVGCIAHSFVNVFYITLGFNLGEDELCDSLGDASSCTYGLTVLTVQTFLWTRQRAFYANRMLNVNYNKKVRLFSTASIIIIFTAGTSVLVFNIYPDDHTSTLDGCRYKPDDSLRVGYWASVVIVIVFGQMSLLGLFVYALTQTRSQDKQTFMQLAKEFCACSNANTEQTHSMTENLKGLSETSHCSNVNTATPSSATSSSRRRRSKSGKVRDILRKTLVFAIISILADAFVQLFIHYITTPEGHRRFSVAVGNMNVIFSLLLLVFSFTDYREMLSSPFR